MKTLDCPPLIPPAMRRGAARPARGFSLIELMVALGILGAVVAAGLPDFSRFVRDTRLGGIASDLRADMQFARSESIRRNARVIVCPRSTTTSTVCATTVTAATWMNGWLVCYDTGGDGACDTAPVDGSDPNPGRVRTGYVSPISLSGPAAAVTFSPVGSLVSGSAAALFTMTANTSVTRTLSVAISGSLTSTKT